ncbi:MAG: glycoside hydrolase family 3 protein [Burkholderiales bacterium]|nr:glycoside hydrolase family 3 protein [Burkholderiales bacterium]
MGEPDLRSAPFHLDDDSVAWVERTLARLPIERKVRQLLNVGSHTDDLAENRAFGAAQLGGVTRLIGADPLAAWQATRALIEQADVPLLISGDIEGGGIRPSLGTPVPNHLGLAATGSVELASEVIAIVASEALALGFNWTFTPVLDINRGHRSPVVATRSYGSDIETILAHARANVRGFQQRGIATTLKHWPGEGLDDRDQHSVTTINPMAMDEWEATFGRLYRTLIGDGALSVMSAHVALPAWQRRAGVPEGLELYRPAAISAGLNNDLLRGELGFNGVIVSDATAMGGVTSWAARAEWLPQVIANGCDVLLFPTPLADDLRHLMQALSDGRLSEARVEQAARRVLGMKAALGLHRKTAEELLPSFEQWQEAARNPRHADVARRAAERSVTLVKDVRNLLPLDPVRHRRVLLVQDPHRRGGPGGSPPPLVFGELLARRGFEVRAHDGDHAPTPADTDLIVYVMAQESVLLKDHIGIDWLALHGRFGLAMQRWWHEIPTLLVSFGQPYHLYDAPRMPCVVNAYGYIPSVQQAVVERLVGAAPFTGRSPVDAFCGLPDARY